MRTELVRHRDRWAAYGAAAVLHGVFFLLVSRELRELPAAEPPPISVLLVPLAPTPSASASRPSSEARPRRPRDQDGATLRLERAPVAPPSPGAGATGASEVEGARRILRGLVGCRSENLAAVTPDERERCQERLGIMDKAGAPKLNLDPTGRFAENPEPYLNRKAKNGCKLRAAGDVSPRDDEGARVGVGCAFSF